MTSGLLLEGVEVGYRGQPVLSGLGLPAVPPGAMVAVVGANAAGKSTLLRAVAGLHPAKGRMALDGEELPAMAQAKRTRLVGYLPQALPQGTSLVAYEALYSGCRAARPDLARPRLEAMVEEVLRALGIEDLALRRLDRMSGGQRQMVGLAQAIARRPRLLLLDEPTSALDLRWQLRVLEAVRAIADRDGAVCLVAMHDLTLAARFCDSVAVLGQGRLLAAGPPRTAMSPEVLRAAFGVEARVETCSRGGTVVLADRAAD